MSMKICDLVRDEIYPIPHYNYYSNDCTHEFSDWEDFIDSIDPFTMDIDWNLIYRWSVVKDEEDENSQDTSIKYTLILGIMLQRKGIYQCWIVNNVDDSCVDVLVELLQKHKTYIDDCWDPIK